MEKIKKLSSADQATIVELQPHRENRPTLFGLHEADRIRKHTALVAFGSATEGTLGGLIDVSSSTAELRRVTLNGVTARHLKIDLTKSLSSANDEAVLATGLPARMPFEVTPVLAYASPDVLKDKKLIPTLQLFASEVERIVAKFA